MIELESERARKGEMENERAKERVNVTAPRALESRARLIVGNGRWAAACPRTLTPPRARAFVPTKCCVKNTDNTVLSARDKAEHRAKANELARSPVAPSNAGCIAAGVRERNFFPFFFAPR